METAEKLIADLIGQGISEESGDTRTEWVSPAHFVEKPKRVPLALRLVVDYMGLNRHLVRDQATTFPTSGDIRQKLGQDCNVWLTADALVAY